jgi:rhodanese-related sulfurtransferase
MKSQFSQPSFCYPVSNRSSNSILSREEFVMSQKLVQINARLVIPVEDFEKSCTAEAALPFANVDGLQWKIWPINRETGEAGGIKLFESEEKLAAYMAGPIWQAILNFPAWTDCQFKIFDILTAPSRTTRAPLEHGKAVTFNQSIVQAITAVPQIKPADAYQRMQKETDLLVIDVRDSSEVAQTGTVQGAVNLAYGSLTYLADNEVPLDWRDPRLADRSRPIITTCIMGPLGALGGKLLHDMGFSNVQILEGGVQAWINAGLPVGQP